MTNTVSPRPAEEHLSAGKPTGYCTTREAAKLLGLSLGKVQQMTEKGELQAWKTSGGHRRVSMQSVERLLRARGQMASSEKLREEIDILIAEDDLDLQTLYRQSIATWNLPIAIRTVTNGIDGLLNIGLRPPDVLIADLMMPGVDGFEMIRRLREKAEFDDMDIVVVTGMENDQIDQHGGLHPTVTVYQKPIPFTALRGYLQAKISQRRRVMLPKPGAAESAGLPIHQSDTSDQRRLGG